MWGRYFITSTSLAPAFPIGLVKTESDFIVRSDETGLERWMLVVAVVTDPPDSKETDFGSSDQEASGVVLVPCHVMEMCSYNYFW